VTSSLDVVRVGVPPISPLACARLSPLDEGDVVGAYTETGFDEFDVIAARSKQSVMLNLKTQQSKGEVDELDSIAAGSKRVI